MKEQNLDKDIYKPNTVFSQQLKKQPNFVCGILPTSTWAEDQQRKMKGWIDLQTLSK